MSLLEVIRALHNAEVSLFVKAGLRFKAAPGTFSGTLRAEAKRWRRILRELLADCESRIGLDSIPSSAWMPFDSVSQSEWEALEERIGILNHDAGFPLPWATVIAGAALGLITDVANPMGSLGGAA